jgi:hypothetical protein
MLEMLVMIETSGIDPVKWRRPTIATKLVNSPSCSAIEAVVWNHSIYHQACHGT